jgi:hypothetical protein
MSNTALYDFLLSIGLTSNKSKTISVLGVPPEYYADFLRGCFDGDGTTYSYWDTRWKSSFMYYIAFVSASPPFLEWLRRENVLLAKVLIYITNPGILGCSALLVLT